MLDPRKGEESVGELRIGLEMNRKVDENESSCLESHNKRKLSPRDNDRCHTIKSRKTTKAGGTMEDEVKINGKESPKGRAGAGPYPLT